VYNVYQFLSSSFSARARPRRFPRKKQVFMRPRLGLHAASLALVAIVTLVPSAFAANEPGPEAPGARRLRVDECVELALRNNVDVQSAADDVALREAQRSGARGMIGPKLRVDAYAHEWTSPYSLSLAVDPTQPAASFPVRDQFEWNATVSLTQPITGLFAIFDAYKIRALGVDVASIRREVARRETAYRVIESYYRLAEAETLVDVATASVEQLGAQLKQSQSFHTNGVVSKDDVLRAELALASAQQRLIQMRARVSLEQARLEVLVGASPGTVILTSRLGEAPAAPAEAFTLAQAERASEAQRVELVELDKRIEQSDRALKIAWLKLAPQVSVVGAYIHNEGSTFAQTNSAYVGAVAAWDVWDWGTTSSAIKEARILAHQATLARTKVADGIRLEVRATHLELAAASEAMTVARAAVASAEENFRLVKKRYDASAATSFDVVDAEGLLTTARAMGAAPGALTKE
jgi:outer membrane protein